MSGVMEKTKAEHPGTAERSQSVFKIEGPKSVQRHAPEHLVQVGINLNPE